MGGWKRISLPYRRALEHRTKRDGGAGKPHRATKPQRIVVFVQIASETLVFHTPAGSTLTHLDLAAGHRNGLDSFKLVRRSCSELPRLNHDDSFAVVRGSGLRDGTGLYESLTRRPHLHARTPARTSAPVQTTDAIPATSAAQLPAVLRPAKVETGRVAESACAAVG